MKAVLVLVLVLLAFFACLSLGFNLAEEFKLGEMGVVSPTPVDLNNSSQNNVLVIVVDHMNQPETNLMAVWFVSLYLMDGSQPALTFAPVYTLYSNGEQSKVVADSFALNDRREPTQQFWNTLSAMNIQWQGYVMVDLVTARRFVEWSGMYGDPPQALLTALGNPLEGQAMAGQLCQSISSAASRPPVDVNWSELVPDHLQTNLRLESGMLFWQRMTHASPPVRCEILPPS